MLYTSRLAAEDRWEHLQQPSHPSDVDPQFRTLLAAMDLGWRIEEPVYLRPRWSEADPRVYHFILRRGLMAPPRIVSVPESPAVDQFVHDESLRLVVGH